MQSILKLTGVHLEDSKLYLLEARLSEIMKEYNLVSYDQVAMKLEKRDDRVFIDKVIENITTHETRFFRDESVYDAFILQIIPEWFDKNRITPLNLKGTKLQIWSAACSTGQEPYSIAMMLLEKFPQLAGSISILGTDISKYTLDKASTATFTKFEVERGLPSSYLQKYFEPNGDKYILKKSVASCVSFKQHNLMTDPYPGQFDIIFCRNVAIYFTESARKEIYNKLKNALKQEGVLMLGSSESLMGYIDNYVLRDFGLARYYEFASNVTFFSSRRGK